MVNSIIWAITHAFPMYFACFDRNIYLPVGCIVGPPVTPVGVDPCVGATVLGPSVGAAVLGPSGPILSEILQCIYVSP